MTDAVKEDPRKNTGASPLLQEMFRSHWRIEDDINSARMTHMTKVGKLRAQQAEVKTRVKDAGYSVRAFRELCNEEADRRRVANRKAKLEEDDLEAIDQQRELLGDLAGLPLGQAALGEAPDDATPGKKDRKARAKATADSLDAVGDQQTKDNVHRLQTGITEKTS